MRILFVTDFYPPLEVGGMEQMCEEVVKGLTARGHDTHVLTSRYGIQSRHLTEKEVSRALHLQADVYHYRPLNFFLFRSRQESTNVRTLQHTVQTFSPDVIFIWGMWNLSPKVAYWAEQALPGRVAYYVASHWLIEPDVHQSYWDSPARRRLVNTVKHKVSPWVLGQLQRERLTYPLELRHVACVSAHVRQKLSSADALPYGAQVIYNGIDPDPFVRAATDRMSPDGALRLIYIGGLGQHKGVHTAIEALALLRDQDSITDLSLTIVGGGHPTYEAYLRDMVTSFEMENVVKFVGRMPRERIPELLAEADVFLFTSVWDEPIARTVMEAMASGLAVIASPVGGQQEMLVDGENTLVFTPGDAMSLADRILQLQQQPDLLQRIAETGRQSVLGRFSLERMIDEIEQFLGAIVPASKKA